MNEAIFFFIEPKFKEELGVEKSPWLFFKLFRYALILLFKTCTYNIPILLITTRFRLLEFRKADYS